MEITLCSKEFADEYSLMHYRTKGSKNGIRRYQYKDGKLTPEGYQHYKEMYGWGEKRQGGGGVSRTTGLTPRILQTMNPAPKSLKRLATSC